MLVNHGWNGPFILPWVEMDGMIEWSESVESQCLIVTKQKTIDSDNDLVDAVAFV